MDNRVIVHLLPIICCEAVGSYAGVHLRFPGVAESTHHVCLNIQIRYGSSGLRGGPYHRGHLPMEGLADEEKQELKAALKEMGVI